MQTRTTSRERIARYRSAQRQKGLRPVLLWLPDENNPAYRARMAEACHRVSNMTQGHVELVEDFMALGGKMDGWR